jgi:hypothetical protein
MGLVKLGTIAVDGAELKANASRHKAMSYGYMLKAEAELKAHRSRPCSTGRARPTKRRGTSPSWTSRRRLHGARTAWTPSPRRARLEQRQREADTERGRSHDDDQKPRDPDGKPKGGRYKRPLGVPEDKTQDNFTDPDSRIMQRTGGGFDAAYNAQTAVDDTAHIIVAAELINNASDVRELPTMVQAVKDTLGAYREQTLADAGYRSEAVFGELAGRTDPGGGDGSRRQGAPPGERVDAAADRGDGCEDEDTRGTRCLPSAQMARRATQRLDQERLGLSSVQHARAAPSAGGVETRVPGA